MKVSIQKFPQSKIEVTVEVSVEKFKAFQDQAFLSLTRELQIKGFRKGKIPSEIAEREIDSMEILDEAARKCIQEVYFEIISKENLEILGAPEIEILKLAPGNPFSFKIKVWTMPEVRLPDCRVIASRVKRKKISVDGQEVEGALQRLRKSRARLSQKSGPAERDDFVEIEYSSPQIEQGRTYKDSFILGEGHFIPGFEEKIMGMKNDDEREFLLPADNLKVAIPAKEVVFRVKMKSVQSRSLPELSDDFARTLGRFENLAALKGGIKEGINAEKEMAEFQRIRNEVLGLVCQDAQLDIPEILILREQKNMFDNLKTTLPETLKISFEDYLNRTRKTETEIKDSLWPEAQKRVKNYLVLRAIRQKENIEASEEEVEDGVNKILKRYSTLKQAEKEVDPASLKEYIKEEIETEKALQFLEQFVSRSE